jgi:uncharacterized protein
MSIFVDTSALYAFLVSSDAGHASVADALGSSLEEGRTLKTTSYVLVETTALLQHRVGLMAVRDLQSKITPLLGVVWVDHTLHGRAVKRLFREDRRSLSLVDCVSFEVMDSEGIRDVLTLDRHFSQAGFDVLPT